MRKPPNERLTGQPRTPAKAGSQSTEPTGPRLSPGNGPGAGERERHVPERKCILTGEHDARDRLIRLAVSPGGEVLPDVRARAPGRGAWIGVDRPTLETAQAKGKLKGALSRSFKTAALSIPDDLGDRIETALRQTMLDRLGLEARAGALITGAEKIETAARKGEVHLLLHAADASEDGRRKLDQAWRAGGCEEDCFRQGVVFPADRSILSLALGRQNVVHVALIDRAASSRVRHALDRWRDFIGPNEGLSAGSADAPGTSAVDEIRRIL